MVVAEAPGYEEDKIGEPLARKGKTGQEMRRLFNGSDLPDFEDVFRTNLYRHYGGKDYEYTKEDLERDEPDLLDEIARVQPKTIISVGRHSTRWLLGDVALDEVHGLPWALPTDSKAAAVVARTEGRIRQSTGSKSIGRTRSTTRGGDLHTGGDGAIREIRTVVFPTYHPAAGFRSPEASALVSYDFAQLALYYDGALTPRVLFDDPYPKTTYIEITSPGFFKNLKGIDAISLDSEGWPDAPWSVQFSYMPGFGYLIRADNDEVMRAFFEWVVTVRPRMTFHSALHDRPMLRAMAAALGYSADWLRFELDTLPFDDTMIMAYLLQLEPQGLKPLCTRLCNMRMQDYDEVMGDAQNKIALDYLLTLWDSENLDYEYDQQREFARINRTPLVDPKTGKPKRTKDGQIKYRRTTVLPKLPKSDLFKAVERCMRSTRPYELWIDQRDDIEVAGYRLGGQCPRASLSEVDFATKALPYGCRDADGTERVRPQLQARIEAMGLKNTYDLELRTYPLIDRMGTVGMKPDLGVFAALSKKLDSHVSELQVQLEEQTGRENFNANSGDQVASYLFEDLGLTPIKMTGGGEGKEARASTNDKILETLEKEHGLEYPAISTIREYRETYKLKNTFVDRIPDYTNRYPFDGRIHATFRTTRVITGRLAASDPNLLAQPEHGKFAKEFKLGWVAEEGHVLVAADESQIELRCLAHMSQDPVLLEAYRYQCPHRKQWEAGKTICEKDECVLRGDLHARLAHMVFGKMPSQQDKSLHRLPAKTHNFGLAMGMTCYGLMIELRKNGVDVDEDGAQEWIDASNKLYKQVPIYKAEKIAEAKRNGYVRCLSGRIRYIGGIRSWDDRLRSEAERFAFSTPIQEAAQWIMKQAEHHIWTDIIVPMWKDGKWIEPLKQVHDALYFEMAEGLQHEVYPKLHWAMTEAPIQISVPLGIEAEWGWNLAPHKVKDTVFSERGMRGF